MQTAIRCVLMRGGTSRGPFFLRDWLPDGAERDRVLLAALGSPHPLQVDGLGGGNSLTSKVAIVSRSTLAGCDIDYLFAQVCVEEQRVDYRPNCGNMLAATVPFAIEQGLLRPGEGTTTARVYNVNTAAEIEVTVQTPNGRLTYDGDTAIDGVPGTSAPVRLTFLEPEGRVLLPTGRARECIDGLEASCILSAMPVVALRAADLGLRGDETAADIDANAALLARIERIRREAGARMGLGDVSTGVVPKPVILAPGSRPGAIASRYLTPHRCHKAHAATGAIAVATAFVTAGTVAHAAASPTAPGLHRVDVEHPSGRISIDLECVAGANGLAVARASLVRTARKIMAGELYIPATP